MSIVPNESLQSADSLNLPTFEINRLVNAAFASPQRIDIFNEHLAFWKNLVIRNHNLATSCFYRTKTSGPFKELGPRSERPVKGWGSYFEVTSAAVPPDIEIDFVCVSKGAAWRK